tara:strand:+ start:7709 stop:8428 length:720 start_codon:yes stop_codon:yes gene_type:complete
MSLNKGIPHPQEQRKRMHCEVPHGYEIDPEEDILIPMFQIPIAHIKVKDWENKKKQLLSLYNNTKENQSMGDDPFDVSTDYHYREGGQYNDSINSILDEELAILETMFLQTDQFNDEYAKVISPECENALYFSIQNSWFEKAKKYEAHYPHHHGLIGYSCVLYIHYDQKEHTPTTFMNPFIANAIGGQSDWHFDEAKEGSLLCWPSSVIHFTHPNSSNKERLILSFNMSPCNSYGPLPI